jgi:hypothetical protein
MPAVLQKKGGKPLFFRHIYIRVQKIDTTDYIIFSV